MIVKAITVVWGCNMQIGQTPARCRMSVLLFPNIHLESQGGPSRRELHGLLSKSRV